jgi:hypothetical protein
MTIVRDGSFLVLALAVTFGAFWSHRLRQSASALPPAD